MPEDIHFVPVEDSPMTSYTFTIDIEPDGEGFRAFYAPLEHLGASTWGSTREEARENIQEVLGLIIEELQEEGAQIPEYEGLIVTDGSEAYFHCGGNSAAASNPGRISPRKTRNRRNDRMAAAGCLRPVPRRIEASWLTKVVIVAAVKADQSGGSVPKQSVMKHLTRCR
jgi:predicted RNase H-like HicB family nuclease